MNDSDRVKQVNKLLDEAIAKHRAKAAAGVVRDCFDDCDASYNACMKGAGSPLEESVCKAALTKCYSNC